MSQTLNTRPSLGGPGKNLPLNDGEGELDFRHHSAAAGGGEGDIDEGRLGSFYDEFCCKVICRDS